MARYSDDMPRWFIDAKELWKRLIEVRQSNKGLDIPYTVNLGINQAIGELNSLPAADVVEVIRCKECTYWQESVDGIHKWCPLLMDKETKADDYCSFGKRKSVKLEDIVDIDAQTKANNEAMRKVIAFMVGERRG